MRVATSNALRSQGRPAAATRRVKLARSLALMLAARAAASQHRERLVAVELEVTLLHVAALQHLLRFPFPLHACSPLACAFACTLTVELQKLNMRYTKLQEKKLNTRDMYNNTVIEDHMIIMLSHMIIMLIHILRHHLVVLSSQHRNMNPWPSVVRGQIQPLHTLQGQDCLNV